MSDQPKLSDVEWELVLELLQRELAELPVEIRHTRTSSVRDALRRREDVVKDLLQRLKVPAGA